MKCSSPTLQLHFSTSHGSGCFGISASSASCESCPENPSFAPKRGCCGGSQRRRLDVKPTRLLHHESQVIRHESVLFETVCRADSAVEASRGERKQESAGF